MKTYRYLLLISLVTIQTWGQSQTISGTVTDESGPLPGANILNVRTNKGVVTDFDGLYEIGAIQGDTLTFSFVGYATAKAVVTSNPMLHVILESTNNLEEVVVTGMGIRSNKKALGYAISQHAVGVLSGKVAGVSIHHDSPTQPSRLYSLKPENDGEFQNSSYKPNTTNPANESKEAEPLYIIDGQAIDPQLNSIVRQLPPNSIENRVVHSPDQAQLLFGDLNGRQCIVITTYRGNYRIQNDESYKRLFENQFKNTTSDPLSTFAIDVDKAGYSNLRRFINNGQKIPVDAVKIEEMVNYFKYDYPTPTDDKPFAMHTEVAQTPYNDHTQIVRIGLKAKEIERSALPPSNLTFLIDVSGSMSAPNKLPLIKKALALLVNQLREQDKIAIVVYAGAAGVVLEPTSGADKERILYALNKLRAGGSTNGKEGIELAYKLALEHSVEGGNNRVIIATDGDFNVGLNSDDAMERLIIEQRKLGIALTCLGFGMGNYKDAKLETLADHGDGNYAYIDTMQEAQKFLDKELSGSLYTLAKDVKIQVEFNPAVVKSYRLLGYENRLLENEDFMDDQKDAGEIGVGHTVTALYEVVLTTSKYNPAQTHPLKYKTQTSLYDNEMLTIKCRYKNPQEDKSSAFEQIVYRGVVPFEEASLDFQFATTVAMSGMKLRESQFMKEVNYSELIALAKNARGTDEDGYRSEFIRLLRAL